MGCASSTADSTVALNKPVAQNHGRQQQPQHNGYSAQTNPNQKVEPTAPPLKDRTPPEGQPAPPPPHNTETNTMEPKQSQEDILEMLKRYIEVEKIVRPLESHNVIGTLSTKKDNLVSLDTSIQTTEKHYKMAADKVAKEKADVDKLHEPSVKSFFKDQTSFDAKMSKEQEEYLEAVNEQEVVKSQLEGLKSQKMTVEKDVKELTQQVNELNKFYDEQDKLLDKIFSGEYGSDLENKLEVEVDQVRDRKDRISLAKYKWSNSRVLLQHACNQLAFAVRRWQELPRVANVQFKYQMATECRNNLIAAAQNITSAQRYLQNIRFPYCERSEIDTLAKACNHIYVDMQSPDRHHHAFLCYSVSHRRSAALLQWFNSVIESTIEKDLKELTESYNKKSTELRKERLRLIKDKMGDKIDVLGLSDGVSSGKQNDIEPELVDIMKPDVVKTEDGQQEETSLAPDDSAPSAPTPLPLEELAPAPSQEELFGNIEQLKKQHEDELKEFEKAQEINKARMEQGLQEKLRQRRNRRERLTEN